MAVLDTFLLLFDADTTKLKKGVDDAKKSTEEIAESAKKGDLAIKEMGESFLKLAEKAGALIGVGFSLKEIVKGVQETAASYFELEKLAKQFHTTAEAVDNFVDAGQLLGLSKDVTVGSLKALDRAVQDTGMGLGRAKKVFEDLGISVKDASGKIKPTTAVMAELQSKMKDMEQGKKIRVMERLGLDPALLKLFNTDMVEMQKRMEKIDSASRTNFEANAKKSIEFTKATKEMWLEIRTLGVYFEKLHDSMNVGMMDMFINAMHMVTNISKKLFDFLVEHQEFAQGFFIAIGSAILYFLLPAAISGAVAVWAMIAPFVAVGAAVLAVAGFFALLYDDVMNFMEGNDSMIGSIVEKYPLIGAAIVDLIGIFKLLWDVVSAIFAFIIDAIDDPVAAFEKFKTSISESIESLQGKFQGLYDGIKSIEEAFKSMGEVAGKVWDSVKGFFGGSTSVSVAQTQLAGAGATPINAATPSVVNSAQTSKTSNVSVGKVEVHTQATDADGISKAIGSSLQSQMKQAVNNHDDGVIG